MEWVVLILATIVVTLIAHRFLKLFWLATAASVLFVEMGFTSYFLAVGGEGLAYLPAGILFSSAILLCISLLTGACIRPKRESYTANSTGVLAGARRHKAIIAAIGGIVAAAATFFFAYNWLRHFFSDQDIFASFIVIQSVFWIIFFLVIAQNERKARARKKRIALGHCGDCGYNLSGSHRRCPECGRPFAPDTRTPAGRNIAN